MDNYTAVMVLIPNMIAFFIIGKYHERWEWNQRIKAKGVSEDQRRARAQQHFMSLNEIPGDG